MAQIYLINKTIIQEHVDVSKNVEDKRILNCVKQMQELDLKPFLGHAFYYEVIQQFDADGTIKDDAPQKYKDLFNGSEYLDRQGHTIIYEGMVPTLVYFTMARFIENDAVRLTMTGAVKKEHDNAVEIKYSDLIKIVQQQRSMANAHANEIEKFLRDNRANFPLWQFNPQNKSARQAGPRIRGIDKTDFNAPGVVNPNANYPFNNFLP